jgi:hypothetical protein
VRTWALVAVMVGLGGCQDITELSPERLPPPARPVIDDGALDDPIDPCGALDVEAPRRLSASPGDSNGARLTVLPRPGGETWVGVAWIERGAEDPDPSDAHVTVQVLLEDGVPLGDAVLLEADTPLTLDLVPVPGTSSFVLASGDAVLGSTLSVVSPAGASPENPSLPFLQVPLPFDSPRVVLGSERGFVVGLEEGDEPVRAVGLAVVTLGETALEMVSSSLPGLVASDLAIAASGVQAWLAWNDGATVLGAPLRETSPGTWEIPEESTRALGPLEGELRRAHGTTDLAIATTTLGWIAIHRLEETGWRTLGIGEDPRGPSEGLAATRGEAGARWAVARTWAPADGGPREIRVERFRTNQSFCAVAGECVRLTTDLLDSAEPDIVAVDSGYLVAWSDALEGGQTDVFVARARCRSTTTE